MAKTPRPFDPYQTWLGIHPEEHPVNHYRLLGLDLYDDQPGRIEAAADRRMEQIRSHQTGPRGHLTQELLNQIAQAKLCLLDSSLKQQYDRRLRSQIFSARQPDDENSDARPTQQEGTLDWGLPPRFDVPANATPGDSAIPTPPPPPLTDLTPRRAPVGGRALFELAWLPITILLVAAIGAAAVLLVRQLGNVGRRQNPNTPDPAQARAEQPAADNIPAAAVAQTADGAVVLDADNVESTSGSVRTADRLLGSWRQAGNRAIWCFHLHQLGNGYFDGQIVYRCQDPVTVTVSVASSKKRLTLSPRRKPDEFLREQFFLRISSPGVHHLALELDETSAAGELQIQQIKLSPRR